MPAFPPRRHIRWNCARKKHATRVLHTAKIRLALCRKDTTRYAILLSTGKGLFSHSVSRDHICCFVLSATVQSRKCHETSHGQHGHLANLGVHVLSGPWAPSHHPGQMGGGARVRFAQRLLKGVQGNLAPRAPFVAGCRQAVAVGTNEASGWVFVVVGRQAAGACSFGSGNGCASVLKDSIA